MRVRFVIPALGRGGPDRVIFEVLSKLDRSRFAPSLAVYEETDGYLQELPADVEVDVLRRPGRTWSRYPADALLAAIWKERPALMVSTLTANLLSGFVHPLLPPGTQSVVRVANDIGSVERNLRVGRRRHRLAARYSRRVYRSADALIAQSDHMARELVDLLGCRAERVYRLHNPIDLERAQRLAAVDSPDLPGAPSFVTVGRLFRQKGLDVLLDGLALAAPSLPDAHVTIVGDGPDLQQLQQQAKRLGVAHMVTFAGFHSAPLPLVAAADFFLLPSRYEGFSNAVLEALALGTPAIVTDCPGANIDMIRPGVDGWLVPTEDAQALADAMVEAARSEPLPRDAIRAGCEQRFAASSIVREWETALLAVIEAAR